MNYEWPNEEIYANMKRRKLTNKNEEPSTATEAVLLDPENRARRREQLIKRYRALEEYIKLRNTQESEKK